MQETELHDFSEVAITFAFGSTTTIWLKNTRRWTMAPISQFGYDFVKSISINWWKSKNNDLFVAAHIRPNNKSCMRSQWDDQDFKWSL